MEQESMAVAAIVPVLNEEGAVGDVVSGLLARGVKPVIVVDNGCTDNSSAVAKTAGATVVYEPKKGYGAACWTGLQSLPPACQWVLFCAGDGQDDLSEVPKLLQATKHASLVLGDRLGTAGGKQTLTPPQRWASWIGGTVIWLGWGHYFADIGGMRVVNRHGIERMDLRDRGFGFFVEMQVRALVLGMPVAEVPITYRPRVTGTPKISGTIKGTLVAATILVSTVIRLYLSELWHIMTVPPSPNLANDAALDNESLKADQILDEEKSLLVGEDLEKGQGENPSQSSFGNKMVIVPVESRRGSSGQRYPGYPVLAERPYISDTGDSLDHDTHGDERLQNREDTCLSEKESRQWKRQKTTKRFLLLVVSAFLLVYGAAVAAMYNDPKEQGGLRKFILGVIMMGVGFLLMQMMPSMSTKWFWTVTFLSRLSGLMAQSLPGDDIYRFVWEGWIQLHGYNPYLLKPTALELRDLQKTSHYMQRVYMGINHPDLTSVYPPMAQLLFRLFALIVNRAEFFKLFFLAAEIAICWLLNCHFGNKRAALYAWNPLVILTSSAGGHFDAWMVLPLVVAWFSCERGRFMLSAFLVGISIAFKWVTAPFLPFLIVAFCDWRGWLRSLVVRRSADGTNKPRSCSILGYSLTISGGIAIAGAAPLVLSALAFCSKDFCRLAPLSSEWATKSRIADFVPRLLYYIMPSTGKLENLWFVLPVIPLLAVVYWGEAGSPKRERWSRFSQFGEVYFFLLLMFSPIVHFWYFTWGLPFVCQSNNLGVRLVSVSAFVSLLRYGANPPRNLLVWEWVVMWCPYIIGYIVSKFRLWPWITARTEGMDPWRDIDKPKGKGA